MILAHTGESELPLQICIATIEIDDIVPLFEIPIQVFLKVGGYRGIVNLKIKVIAFSRRIHISGLKNRRR